MVCTTEERDQDERNRRCGENSIMDFRDEYSNLRPERLEIHRRMLAFQDLPYRLMDPLNFQ